MSTRHQQQGRRLGLKPVDGARVGPFLPLDEEEVILGRTGSGQALLHNDERASRRHAAIRRSSSGELIVEDLRSRNGTYVNGEQITRPHPLRNGDVLQVGGTSFAVVGDDDSGDRAPSSPHSTDDPDAKAALEAGKRHFSAGRFGESEVAFARAQKAPGTEAEALYGLALIRTKAGDFTAAVELLSESLVKNPRDLRPLYQLGVVAEKQGLPDEARAAYEAVVTRDPTHEGAQNAIARLSVPIPARPVENRRAEWPPSITETTETQGVQAPGTYGVYRYLCADDSLLSRDTRALLDRLHYTRRPHLSAYLGTALAHAGMSVLAVAAASRLTRLEVTYVDGSRVMPFHGLPTTVTVIVVLLLALHWMKVVTTNVRIDRGRLQITAGVLRRSVTNIELWRVEDVQLRKGCIQRLTGDGVIALTVGKRKRNPLRIVGLARGQELSDVYEDMLNLVFLLRGNPVVKGIIA
jgi:pSer/pThr/pTyr-binding forkhead associated (FHA) protein/membrane protein YdbS with pleckstrin-like domain